MQINRTVFCNFVCTIVEMFPQIIFYIALMFTDGMQNFDKIKPVLHLQNNSKNVNNLIITVIATCSGGYAVTVILVMCLIQTRRLVRLRSLTSSLLDVRPSRCVAVGDRSFATASPRLWNSLPADVRSASSLTTFHQKLQTHLFWQSYPDIVL